MDSFANQYLIWKSHGSTFEAIPCNKYYRFM